MNQTFKLQSTITGNSRIILQLILLQYSVHHRSKLEEKEIRIQQLLDEISRIDGNVTLTNKGRPLDAVAQRQWRRKVQAIKESCKKALWFLDSFNLDVESVIMRVKGSQDVISLDYNSTKSNYSRSSPNHNHSTTQIDEVLFLLDSFNISDEFYHEISMIDKSLPRSYIIKKRRNEITSDVAICRLARPFFGCYRFVEDRIVENLTDIVSHLN